MARRMMLVGCSNLQLASDTRKSSDICLNSERSQTTNLTAALQHWIMRWRASTMKSSGTDSHPQDTIRPKLRNIESPMDEPRSSCCSNMEHIGDQMTRTR